MTTGGTTSPKINGIGDIPGWFPWIDQQVFAHILATQADTPKGDLVELGVYKGKSAVLIGRYLRQDETFTVCDLFGQDTDAANQQENTASYEGLSQEEFEHNYLALHDVLPVVVRDVSSRILEYVQPGSARFVHVDASHLYKHVAVDVDSARSMLRPDGVVVFDDYRSEHTPGVSAAVWEAVFDKGLAPICVTLQKLYGTFGDPTPHQERLGTWLAGNGRLRFETQEVVGRPMLRVFYPPKRSSMAAGGNEIKEIHQTVQRLSTQMSNFPEVVEREITRSTQRLSVELGELVRPSQSSGREWLMSGLNRALGRARRELRELRKRR